MLLGNKSAALRDLNAALNKAEEAAAASRDDKQHTVAAFDASRARGLIRLLTERGA